MLRVLIADDNQNLCSALTLLIQTRLEVQIAGCVPDMAKLRAGLPVLHPDILILDWEFPELSAPGSLAELRSQSPGLKILVLSARPEAKTSALQAGADAFASKTLPPDHFLSAVRSIQAAYPENVFEKNEA